MKTFILIILGAVILFCCTLGDYAEGCCGAPGKSYTPEKDMKVASIIGIPAIVLFIITLIYL